VNVLIEDDGTGTTMFTVTGDLDHLTAEELSANGLRALSGPSCQRLILQLSGVDFADSTGLGALIRIRNTADAAGQQVVLRHPSAWVSRVLHVTGLDTVFVVERA
jgi:anti-anti-sigma factor